MNGQILIIKSDSNAFERYINKGFPDYCTIVPFRALFQPNANGLARKAQIFKSVIRLRRKHFFDDYDKIIVFDQGEICCCLKLFGNYNKKIILWFWNKLSVKTTKKLPIYKELCEVYSFDERDCETYGLKWNSQFYYTTSMHKTDRHTSFVSLFFAGRNKGRKAIIDQIRDVCEANNISNRLVIVGDKDASGEIIKPLEYEEMLEQIDRCEVVADICQPEQTGITIRTLEAIFSGKRIITNNPWIKEHSFFNENNILVISEDDVSSIVPFVKNSKTGRARYQESILEYYSVEQWLTRFEPHDI